MPISLPEAEVIVVGSGPNGLSAAVESARAGLKALVIEQSDTAGGGVKSAALTLPGFQHDVCSAVYPLAVASPFFRALDLSRFGLTWVQPPSPLAHPLDDGSAALLEKVGRRDRGEAGRRRSRLQTPFRSSGGPVERPSKRHPCPSAFPAASFSSGAFRSESAAIGNRPGAGLFSRCAGPRTVRRNIGPFLPLDGSPSAAIGLVLGICGHVVGWPIPRGGSQRLTEALIACLESTGGTVVTGRSLESTEQLLHPARIAFPDVTPRALLRMAGPKLDSLYRRQLEAYRYGPGAFKVDWAMDGPIPWRAPECQRAGTVHLGGTMEEIAGAVRQAHRMGVLSRPERIA